MSNVPPIIQQIINNIKLVDSKIEDAKELILILEETGNEVTIQQAMLSELIQQKQRWEDSLRSRGYIQ